LLLDVREEVQYQICALPHSINVPLKDLTAKPKAGGESKMAEVLQKASGRPICVICRRGVDSVTATHRLMQYVDGQTSGPQDAVGGAKGNRQIYNVDGGLNEWRRLVDPAFPIY
jgi:adenylyltransferase/sulfurtransferase